MTDRPIIFSTEMVRALIAGRKFQTRRLASSPLRRVEVGDRLYVRESFALTNDGTPVYRADARDQTGLRWPSITPGDPDGEVKWTPSIHMPRWASRLTLEVVRVRFDRLQRISGEDAEAEGVFQRFSNSQAERLFGIHRGSEAVKEFSELWDGLHDKPGERWADDPMIVALTLRVIDGNIDKIKKDFSA